MARFGFRVVVIVQEEGYSGISGVGNGRGCGGLQSAVAGGGL